MDVPRGVDHWSLITDLTELVICFYSIYRGLMLEWIMPWDQPPILLWPDRISCVPLLLSGLHTTGIAHVK